MRLELTLMGPNGTVVPFGRGETYPSGEVFTESRRLAAETER